MKIKELTQKQEKFARLVAEGKNNSDAYRETYNATKMKDKTIWERACFEASKDNVRTRIKQIQDELAKKSQLTAQKQLQTLKEAKDHIVQALSHYKTIEDYKRDIDRKSSNLPKYFETLLKFIELENKMLGFNEPEKIDLTTKGEKINEIKIIKVE